MEWHLSNRGFLPDQDPLTQLKDPALQSIDQLGADLPRLVHEQAFRDKCGEYLKTNVDWPTLAMTRGDADVERLFKLFSYFASAYVHSPGLPEVNRLPKGISVPLVQLSKRVKRPPILSYASYCLHNWRRIASEGPIALGNIELLQNFSMPGDGKGDEDWFILVHVAIEYCAAMAIRSVKVAENIIELNEPDLMHRTLDTTAKSLKLVNEAMNRMPEGCSADVYFKKVRPYIFGFNNIVYEGCFNDEPQSYRGETGAQSSIVPTMLRAFGIKHQNTMLIEHLTDMMKYMPAPHREFILNTVSVRDFVLRHKSQLGEVYNEGLTELIAFRSRHFEYAVNYIERKVDNPIATGGTPYIPWLRQLVEETKEFLIQ